MRTTIRRNKAVSYAVQMSDRALDAERSRNHPNSIANDEHQRRVSRYNRETEAALKWESRQERSARRLAKKKDRAAAKRT